jgi:hypothetical protein
MVSVYLPVSGLVNVGNRFFRQIRDQSGGQKRLYRQASAASLSAAGIIVTKNIQLLFNIFVQL